MGFDDAHHSQDNKAGQEVDAWETPSDEETGATPAIAASSANQISDTLSLVASREMERAELARARDDQKTAVKHFLGAAHMYLVLAEEYADNAQFELAMRSRKYAVSCFWRAGHELQARLLFEELRKEELFISTGIDAVVQGSEPSQSGWGPYDSRQG